jgi:hypothetical protein
MNEEYYAYTGFLNYTNTLTNKDTLLDPANVLPRLFSAPHQNINSCDVREKLQT